MEDTLLYAQFFFIFVAGVIVGRITMAIQYAVMNPAKKHDRVTNTHQEYKKSFLSKGTNKLYTSGDTATIIKPLDTSDLKSRF